jgi:hypothetical protein
MSTAQLDVKKMENVMDSAMVLKALERERALLEEFIYLSEDQLLFMEDRNIDAVSLFARRADLMIELTAIEATLDTWIIQIRTDPSVTPEMMCELRSVSDEIVSMANHIVDIDEQTHARLDVLKERAQTQLQQIERGA